MTADRQPTGAAPAPSTGTHAAVAAYRTGVASLDAGSPVAGSTIFASTWGWTRPTLQ
jgi:hypothetical protein